ncbi:MAG: succinate dehydrogenase assembly factor 2 [Kangiellaceae bacterium]|nr:succinate dehydrogenase assembly factor 2 [Kangiellaceae bacterium]
MTEQQYKKLLWASRRGMLELDVVLLPYLEQHKEQLSEQQIEHYGLFLEQDDPDLYAWIMGFEVPKPEFTDMVSAIRKFVDERVGQ